MPIQRIVCLANSRKLGGRCVAGLAADGSGWVRAVSSSEDGALFPSQYQFADGAEPCPLDLMEIEFKEARPRRHHPEDWLIEARPWRRLPRLPDRDLADLLFENVDAGPALIRGAGDRITFASIKEEAMTRSLALALPESIEIYRKRTLRGNWVARGRFSLAGAPYDLGLTDPVWVNSVTRKDSATLIVAPPGQQILLTLSLSEMFEGCFFKLIATLALLPERLAALLQRIGAVADPISKRS